MKEILINTRNSFKFAWWIEVVTENPTCTYYFGPFMNAKEAQTDYYGYVEDLQTEGAKPVSILIKRCQPTHLTIDAQNAVIKTPVFS